MYYVEYLKVDYKQLLSQELILLQKEDKRESNWSTYINIEI